MGISMNDIREVVSAKLKKSGPDSVFDRDRFLEAVCSSLEASSPECKLLMIGCDNAYLNFFSEAIHSGTKRGLELAAEKATNYLADQYVLDPKVAGPVSHGIAQGCGDYLGIKLAEREEGPRRRRFVKQRRSIKTVVASTVLFAFLASVSLLVYAHFEPIFGSTLIPTKETRDGLDIERYAIRDETGEKRSVFFIENFAHDKIDVSLRSGMKAKSIVPELLRDREGILFADSRALPKDLVTKKLPSTLPIPDELSWSVLDEGGKKQIVLKNNERKRIGFVSQTLVLVVRGPILRYCFVKTEQEFIDYGSITIDLATVRERELIDDPGCELYCLGRRLPKSDD